MGLESLDILIGIVTIYLTFALACTAIVEAISAWLSVRSHTLEKILKEVFAGDLAADKPFLQAFYAHPLIQSLSQGDKGRPSYIPPEIVGQAVLSLITSNDPSKHLAQAIDNLPGTTDSNRVKGLLKVLAIQIPGDATAFRKAVEAHFDAAMDRASGWSKRSHQKIAFIASVLLVFATNVDTIALTKQLSSNPEARGKVLVVAEELLKKHQDISLSASGPKAGAKSDTVSEDAMQGSKDKVTPALKKDISTSKMETMDPPDNTLDNAKRESNKAMDAIAQARALLDTTGLQFGWKDWPSGWGEWCGKFIGLVVSTFAISLGAPFWFDLLQRFMRVRSAGISPREKKS